jgi:RNA polymerase sigma factor for flagellar operon FliA
MTAASAQYQYDLGDGEASRRDALVLQYLPLVRMIAKRVHDRCPPNVSLDDLVSTGVIGLMEAIDNFDPSLKVQLKTYAERRIRGAIIDGLREMDWVPRETRRKAKLIEAAIRAAKQRLGREPSEEEIAAELGISPSDYWVWLNGIQAIDLKRLEHVGPDGEECSLLKFVSDGEENWPSHLLERAELERVLALAIERMPKLERAILNFYYYEELSLSEIAQIVGLHLSRIAQLRVQAVLRLRSHLQRVWNVPPKRKQ